MNANVTRNITRLFLHVCLPLMIGGGIYLSLRSRNLRMFEWADALGLSSSLALVRVYAQHFSPPHWFTYSLPNALWAYAATAFFIIVWRHAWRGVQLAWIAIGASIAIAAEIGQALGVVPGTYDCVDVALCVGATTLCIAVVYPERTKDGHTTWSERIIE